MNLASPEFVHRKWLALFALAVTLVASNETKSHYAWAQPAESLTPAFTVSVVPTACSLTSCTISMAHNMPWIFYVVLTNISDKPQVVWEDGNSWGYRVISFELGTSNGQKIVLTKG